MKIKDTRRLLLFTSINFAQFCVLRLLSVLTFHLFSIIKAIFFRSYQRLHVIYCETYLCVRVASLLCVVKHAGTVP